MATRTPRNRPSSLSPRFAPYPEPSGSPLGPPTPTLAAQLSYMLQQSGTAVAPSPLFQQQRQVHLPSQTPRFAFRQSSPPQQLQTPRSTPQPPTPRSVGFDLPPQSEPPTPRIISLLSPQTPRSVRFDLPPRSQPSTPRSIPDPDPPRQLQETKERCTRCNNVLCIPPSASFIRKTTHFEAVNMDRTRPRCVACDLTRTKELCKDVIAPAPGYVDAVLKIEQDLAKMERYLEHGIQKVEMGRAIVERSRRLDVTKRQRKERLLRVWERFYGAWGPGVRGGRKE